MGTKFTVQFNEPEEFIDEISRGALQCKGHLIRLTKLWRPSQTLPCVHHLSLVATALIDGQLVRLDRYIGEVWGKGWEEKDKEVYARAGAVLVKITGAAKKANLQVRAGLLK